MHTCMARSIYSLIFPQNAFVIGLKLFLFQPLFITAYAEVGLTPPIQSVLIPGEGITFQCSPQPTDVNRTTQWLLNGARLEDLNYDNIHPIDVGTVSLLTFTNIPLEYNDTTIQCSVTFTSGETIYSNNATLLVQGLLPAVTSLIATPIPENSTISLTISLTWTPPFSLDIPGDPDIKYCVDVVNSTSSLVLHSECDIIDPQYNYTVLPNSNIACDTYIFIITPVNKVGNGTSANVTRGLLLSVPQLENEIIVLMDDDHSNIRIISSILYQVCSCRVDLNDAYNTSYKFSMTENVPINQSRIEIPIPSTNNDGSSNLNRIFNGTITLKNSAGTNVTYINRISTYDVQDTTYNIQDDAVTVTIDYIKNTEALGALLALMYLDQDDTILCNQSIYAAIRRNEDNNYTLPVGGDPANTYSYMGLAYDIEKDRLPNELYPAVRRHVNAIRNMEGPSQHRSDCTVAFIDGLISISCLDTGSYQVILLRQNGRNNLTVVDVSSSPVTLSVPDGRYCILELPMEDNEVKFNSEVRYSSEFIAGDPLPLTTTTNTKSVPTSDIIIGVIVLFICVILILSIIAACVATIKLKTRKWKSNIFEMNDYEVPPQTVEIESINMDIERERNIVPHYSSVVPKTLRQISVTESTNLSDVPLIQTPASSQNLSEVNDVKTPPPHNPSDVALDMEVNGIKTPLQNLSDDMEIQTPPPVPPQNLSDELEVPPPVPPQKLSDELKTPPPVPPLYQPPTAESNNPSVGVYDVIVIKDETTGQVAGKDETKQEKNAELVYSDISPKSDYGIYPPDVTVVNYEEIAGFKNKHGHNYALVLPNQTEPLYKPAGDGTEVFYSTLKEEVAPDKKEVAVEGSSDDQDVSLRDGCGIIMPASYINMNEDVHGSFLNISEHDEDFKFVFTLIDNPGIHCNMSDATECTEKSSPGPIVGELYTISQSQCVMSKPDITKMPDPTVYMCRTESTDDKKGSVLHFNKKYPSCFLVSDQKENEVDEIEEMSIQVIKATLSFPNALYNIFQAWLMKAEDFFHEILPMSLMDMMHEIESMKCYFHMVKMKAEECMKMALVRLTSA